jgi:hypothetical protein
VLDKILEGLGKRIGWLIAASLVAVGISLATDLGAGFVFGVTMLGALFAALWQPPRKG